MQCYKDSQGHVYDFGFGLNWKGVIHDARTEKYVDVIKKPKVKVNGATASLSCETKDVKVYYTTDGSTPAFVEGNEYSKPFAVKKGATIKTIAKRFGFDNSGLVEYEVK